MNKKLIILFLAVLLSVNPAFAQGKKTQAGLITPSSPFYFLDDFGEKLITLFAFTNKSRAEKLINQGEEKLAEIETLVEKGEAQNIEKTTKRFNKRTNGAFKNIEKAQNKGQNVEDIGERLFEATLKHQEVLQDVYLEITIKIEGNETKLPKEAQKVALSQAQEALKKAIENSMKVNESLLALISELKKKMEAMEAEIARLRERLAQLEKEKAEQEARKISQSPSTQKKKTAETQKDIEQGQACGLIVPKIDGVKQNGEWNDAQVKTAISFTLLDTGRVVNGQVYMKHTNSNLYIGVEIFNDLFWILRGELENPFCGPDPDVRNSRCSNLWVYFDEFGDSRLTPGDEDLLMFPGYCALNAPPNPLPLKQTYCYDSSIMQDRYYKGELKGGSYWWIDDSLYSGNYPLKQGAVTHSNPVDGGNGNYFFEFKVSLNAADPFDLQTKVGEKLGLAMLYGNNYEGWTFWPVTPRGSYNPASFLNLEVKDCQLSL